MLKRWFVKTKELWVEFCDRCGSVCGSACRAMRIRTRALDSALRHGGRPL